MWSYAEEDKILLHSKRAKELEGTISFKFLQHNFQNYEIYSRMVLMINNLCHIIYHCYICYLTIIIIIISKGNLPVPNIAHSKTTTYSTIELTQNLPYKCHLLVVRIIPDTLM